MAFVRALRAGDVYAAGQQAEGARPGGPAPARNDLAMLGGGAVLDADARITGVTTVVKKLRPPVHGKALPASAAPAPQAARISCERREMQIARLPLQYPSSASTTRLATPCRWNREVRRPRAGQLQLEPAAWPRTGAHGELPSTGEPGRRRDTS